jgi:hypothetical protein
MATTSRGKYVGETDEETVGLDWNCSMKDLYGNFVKIVSGRIS